MVGDFLSARLSAMFCTVCALVYLPFTCSVSLTLGKTLINSTFVAGNLFENLQWLCKFLPSSAAGKSRVLKFHNL